MKGFVLLVAALAGAALLYVTTAVGGQQAGPSRAEFNALKKQVAVLKKDDATTQSVLNNCFTSAVPAASFDGYEYRAADGSTVLTSAIDVISPGDTPTSTMYLLDVGQACASVIDAASKFHGLKLIRPQASRR